MSYISGDLVLQYLPFQPVLPCYFMLLVTGWVSYKKYIMLEFLQYIRMQETDTYQAKCTTMPKPTPHLIRAPQIQAAKKQTLQVQFSLHFCNCFSVPMVPNGILTKSVGVAAEAKYHVGSSFSYTDAWAVRRIAMLLSSFSRE